MGFPSEMNTVLVIGGILHCAIALVCSVVFVWMWTLLQAVLPTDDIESAAYKLWWRRARQVALIMALTNAVLGCVLLGMRFGVGNAHRDPDNTRTNWSYFIVGESAAFAALAIVFAIYYAFDGYLNIMLLAFLWAMWAVSFGAASLYPDRPARDFLFAAGVVIQAPVSLVFFWCAAHGFHGIILTTRGILPLVGLLASLLCYDVFWYTGYFNTDQSGAEIKQQWLTQMLLLFGSFCTHVALPALMAWFYVPRKHEAQEEVAAAALRARLAKLEQQATAESGEASMPLTSDQAGQGE